MLDHDDAFDLACRIGLERIGAPSWADEYAWMRDLDAETRGRAVTFLVTFMLSAAGIANVAHEPAGGRGTIQVGGLVVDAHLTTQHEGMFRWAASPPTAEATHVLFVGVSPAGAEAELLTHKEWTEIGHATAWFLDARSHPRTLGDVLDELRDAGRESLRRAVRSVQG